MPPSTAVDPEAREIDTAGRAVTEIVRPADVVPPAVAVTVASRDVVRFVDARPAESVLTTAALNEPAVVVNVTGTPAMGFPDASNTPAVIVVVPPLAGTDVGFAARLTRPVAAAPTFSS